MNPAHERRHKDASLFIEARDEVKRLSLHSPEYNYREVIKQMLLLEEHLFQPHKLCPDCVRKHLMMIEALAEEAVTLMDHSLVPAVGASQMAEAARVWLERFNDGETPQTIGDNVRSARKKLVRMFPDPRDLADQVAAVHVARSTLCPHKI